MNNISHNDIHPPQVEREKRTFPLLDNRVILDKRIPSNIISVAVAVVRYPGEKDYIFAPLYIWQSPLEGDVENKIVRVYARSLKTIPHYHQKMKDNLNIIKTQSVNDIELSMIASSILYKDISWESLAESAESTQDISAIFYDAFLGVIQQSEFFYAIYPVDADKTVTRIITSLVTLTEEEIIENNDTLVEFFRTHSIVYDNDFEKRKTDEKIQYVNEYNEALENVEKILNTEKTREFLNKITFDHEGESILIPHYYHV